MRIRSLWHHYCDLPSTTTLQYTRAIYCDATPARYQWIPLALSSGLAHKSGRGGKPNFRVEQLTLGGTKLRLLLLNMIRFVLFELPAASTITWKKIISFYRKAYFISYGGLKNCNCQHTQFMDSMRFFSDGLILVCMASRVVAYSAFRNLWYGWFSLCWCLFTRPTLLLLLLKRALNFQRPFSLKINCAKKVVIWFFVCNQSLQKSVTAS